jgi:predicted  nucleic acid-binding Zn-ribbon protein
MADARSQSQHELLAVQDHDRTLDGLRHQRATLPERARLQELEVERKELRSAIEVVEEQRHELGRTQKRLEDEVAMLDERIATETAKLYGGDAGGMKELQALQEEIDGLGKRKTLVEDQIIEIMEQAEPLDAELARLADTDGRILETEDEVHSALAEAEAEIDKGIAETEAERAQRAAGVPAELLETYEKLRARPGSVGVARLVGSTCHGCHLELAAVEVDRLKKLPPDELVFCEECGCILVR